MESSAVSAPASVPLTAIPGVRPLLLLATTVISAVHLSWARLELGRSVKTADCRLVGSFVAAVGIMNAICAMALLCSAWMHPPPPRTAGRCLRACRFSIYGLAFFCIPACFVLGILGALWVHVDNCWEHVYMRNLTVVDAVCIQMAALVAIHYLWRNYISQWEWIKAKRQAWSVAPRCACCVRIVRAYRRILFVLLVLVACGCARTLSAYHARRSRSFHWVMSARPAACAISCSEIYRPLAREQLCFDGHGVQVSIQHCMDDLNPNERFPQGHANLQPCIQLNCTASDGTPRRYHWSLRAEHLFDASDCSKHDRRAQRQVSLLQEYGCFDEHTLNWVDESPHCISERTESEWSASQRTERGSRLHTDDPSILPLFVDPAQESAWGGAAEYRYSPDALPSQPLPPLLSFPRTAERVHETYYELWWRDRHCGLMCKPGMDRQWSNFLAQLGLIASILLRAWMGGAGAGSSGPSGGSSSSNSGQSRSGDLAPLLSSSSSSSSSATAAASSSSSGLPSASSSPPPPSSLQPPPSAPSVSSPPPDLRFLRRQLAASNAHSWLIVRVCRTLVAVHGPGGLGLLDFPLRLAVRLALLSLWLWLFLEALRDAVWMSDTHCRSTLVQSTLNDAVVFLSVAGGIAGGLQWMQSWVAHWDPVAQSNREVHEDR